MPNPLLPKVTVITPTYNRADLLGPTIESVLSQDYPNIEYLILDDGSTDNTKELVADYAARYPNRIDYLYHNNKGEAETVNDGWRNASGDYVVVINSDDPQPSHLIRRSVETMLTNEDILVTYPDWVMTDIQGNEIWHNSLKEYGFKHMLSYAHCFIGPGAMINRKALAGRMHQLRNKAYPYISDFECWLEIGLLGSFRHIPETLANWCSHDGSITHQHSQEMSNMVIDLLTAFYRRPNLPDTIKALETQSLVSAHMLLLNHQLRQNLGETLRKLIALFFTHPYCVTKTIMAYSHIIISRRIRKYFKTRQ